MNIQISDVQVTDNKAITKRMSALIGADIRAMETYNMTATPKADGGYEPIDIKTVSFDHINGVVIKSNGISEYLFMPDNGASRNTIKGSSFLIDRLVSDGQMREININPLYSVVDYAVVENAVYNATTRQWTLTIKERNYVYSSITGTPITGKLEMINRRLVLSSEGRIAELVIDEVLQPGDKIDIMTSDEYHIRVAEELQRKLNFFFGENYCNVIYDISISSYVFSLKKPGANQMAITSSRSEDLSYFGMRCPSIKLGSPDMNYPSIRFMAGPMAEYGDIDVVLSYPNKMIVAFPSPTPGVRESPDSLDIDAIDETIMLCQKGEIKYEVILYQ